jgi:endonuclease/exonuclease/phosphatase family metal-dependent hydrolase
MKRFIYIIIAVCMLSACSKADPFTFKADHDISIMSFNLRYDTDEDGDNRWDKRKDACINMLKETSPAIIGIQEGLQHQVDLIKEKLPEYDYVGIKSEGGYYGEYKAIFYNKQQFNVVKSNTFWLSETPDIQSYGWDANNIRIVTWAHFTDKYNGNRSLYVFNTHLDHKGKQAREESVKLLIKKIDEITDRNSPVFITGDFNVIIRDKALTPLLNQYYSARRFAEYTDNTYSFNAFGRWYLSRNIDFIFYKGVKALSFRTVREDYGAEYISDHYPIITHFNYK